MELRLIWNRTLYAFARFLLEAGAKLRKEALAAVVDFGRYLILWAGVFFAYLVTLAMKAAGVEPMIITAVSFMEKWVWIASFGAFFMNVLFAVFRSLRKDH